MKQRELASEVITTVIKKNMNEPKLFDEWVNIINAELPPRSRYVSRSIAHIVESVSRKSGMVMVRKNMSGCLYYEFRQEVRIQGEIE